MCTCEETNVRYSRVEMLDDALTLVSWRARPRSFVALMGLYESNYIRLQLLAGKLTQLTGEQRSVVPGDCDLVLTVLERSAYTSTLCLTYLLPEAGEPLTMPDMRMRIYHDAHLVEAQDCGRRAVPGSARRSARTERELDQRGTRNMMLNKWLEYCVERGHRFSPAVDLSGG